MFGIVTTSLAQQFADLQLSMGLAAQLAEVMRKQQLAIGISKPMQGVVTEALAKQFSTGVKSRLAETMGAHLLAAKSNAGITDALRPKTLRFAEQLLKSPGYQSMIQMHAFELGAEVFARVDVAAAVSVATETLGDAPAIEAIGDAAAELDGGPLGDVAKSQDWPLLALLLAILYLGVASTLYVRENPDAAPEVAQATAALALALLVVLKYADKQR
jgi:hypothetical protein